MSNKPYDLAGVTETARQMLARYSTPKVASEMAHWHAMDYTRDSAGRLYWQAVGRQIDRLAKEQK